VTDQTPETLQFKFLIMKKNNSRLIFLDGPFNFKCKKLSKLSFPARQPLYCSSDLATAVFFGPLNENQTLKLDLVRLEQELNLSEEAVYLDVKEGYRKYHLQWVQKDEAAVLAFADFYLFNPLANLRLILERRRFYLDLFRVYARFRYPSAEVFFFFKKKQNYNCSLLKRRFDYASKQLKLRHAYMVRVDRFCQSLFQCLREVRDTAVWGFLYTTFVQKLLNVYFRLFLIKQILPYSWSLLGQGALILLSLFPVALKNSLNEFYIIMLAYFPGFVLIGSIVIFIPYVHGLRTQSRVLILQCVISFWVKLLFLFLGWYLISRHPIIFIIFSSLLFTFQFSPVPEQL
jgi:hypothetical protein